MKVGFDLDRVFIDYPPFVPGSVIDWLYRHSPLEIIIKKPNNKISYRIPTNNLEVAVRKLSHLPIFRPKIEKNIQFVKNFPQNPYPHELFLISSRYKFLEQITWKLLESTGLRDFFKSIHLNLENEQPHKFKEKVIKELKLDVYIDDDLRLLRYLKNKFPKLKLLWYNPKTKLKSKYGITVLSKLNSRQIFNK